MRNPFIRGSSPGRARDDLQRPGDFQHGHKKLGGRKKGTPNRFSATHKKAMLEAIHRIGYDGNGKDGAVGYFKWVAGRDLTFFYVDVWSRLLEVPVYDAAMHVVSTRVTIDRAPPRRALHEKTTRPLGWLRGDDDPYESLVQDYMRMAVEGYKPFCKLYVAGFLTPPKNWRTRLAQNQRDHSTNWPPAVEEDREQKRDQELKFAEFAHYLNSRYRPVTP